MRLLPAILLLALAANAAEPAPFPLWNGEPIEQYARRAKLETTQTLDLGNGVKLDLGNGVKLDLVLIPAGKFTMGTPEPAAVDEEGYRKKIVIGQAVLAAGAAILLVFLAVIVIRAIRQHRRPQYSLARLLAMTFAAGVALLGGLHWHFSAKGFAEAKAEYQTASARFKDSYETEKPAHEVTLTKPYYMGKYELTQEQYQQVMGTNPSDLKGRDLSVETVSWDEAQEFCKKASDKTGSVVRLPTDAEWERACRAGTRTTYSTGDTEADLDRAGWYAKNSNDTAHPVGRKAPNDWGVYDMHGSVWEWCGDRYEAYKAEAAVDPQGPAQGQNRVLRGGSWSDDPGGCRSASRGKFDPDYRFNLVGFRVVVVVAPRTP